MPRNAADCPVISNPWATQRCQISVMNASSRNVPPISGTPSSIASRAPRSSMKRPSNGLVRASGNPTRKEPLIAVRDHARVASFCHAVMNRLKE